MAWDTWKLVAAGMVLLLCVGAWAFYIWLVLQVIDALLTVLAWVYQISLVTGSQGLL